MPGPGQPNNQIFQGSYRGKAPCTQQPYIASEKGWDLMEIRHIFPAATPEDIDLLLDGMSDFYLRLSDECINEIDIVYDLIKWIGRSRYGR
jgi:hypothetical protein